VQVAGGREVYLYARERAQRDLPFQAIRKSGGGFMNKIEKNTGTDSGCDKKIASGVCSCFFTGFNQICVGKR
jgi:hypothetical protein